jgi:benzoyl-CoA reductase subunit C
MSEENAMRTVETFPGWRGKETEEIFQICRETIEENSFSPVRRWREAGGKVLGHFQVYFPEELAHAAGMLPVKIRGCNLDAAKAESRFGSYLCNILKSSLELAISGRVQLDLFVSHPICDAARNLAAIFGRNAAFPSQILYLPQNANSAHAVEYLREEYARVLRDVETAAGRKVTADELRRSIDLFNGNRRRIRELYAIRRETPWLLPVDECWVLLAMAGMLPREEHNALIDHLLPRIRSRTAAKRDRIRVVFEGGFCEQPPLDLLASIGRSCYVVDDDLLIGLRFLTEDVPLDGDPLLRLAEAYLERSTYSPVQHDLRKPKEKMLLDRIAASGADAAIVAAAKMCEPGLEDQVGHIRALEEKGIPCLVSEFQENMSSFEQFEMQLETFVENILFA